MTSRIDVDMQPLLDDSNGKSSAGSDGYALQASFGSFARLGLTWMAAVICGGYSPGQALFAFLFQEAGLFRSFCEGTGHKTCEEQYVIITNILSLMFIVMMLWMLFGGLAFDALGSRAVGVYGALFVALSVALLIPALAFDLPSLFVLAIALGDMGSIMNNFGFYGLLYHLPGWQALVIALSNSCIQVSSYLPVAIQEFMRVADCSLIQALAVFGACVLLAAVVTYAAVPSQAEYFARAQAVLGVPIGKPKASFSKVRSATWGAWRVLRHQGWVAMSFTCVIIVANTATAAYSVLAVPFGTALFDNEQDAGQTLSSLYLDVSAMQGLIFVPITGMLVDTLGMPFLAAALSVDMVIFSAFIGTASWPAQATASFCTAFSANVYLLLLVKYLVAFSPPDRLGTVQGLWVALIGILALPIIMGSTVFVSSSSSGALDLGRLLSVTYICSALSSLGWFGYFVHLLRSPETEVTLLEDDEKELMKRFGVSSIADAQEVLGMDRKQLLKMLSSSNVLDHRELQLRYKDKESQLRYLSLAKRVANAIDFPSLDPVHEAVHGVIVRTATAEELLPAALQAFGGGRGERGEPTFDYMWKDITDGEDARLKFLSSWVGMQIHLGCRFGHALALSTAGGPIEAACICYPPHGLQDGSAMATGSERWMYGVTKMGQNLLTNQMNTKVQERFIALASTDIEKRQKELPPHWHVALLGVVPGNRGKKRGKILLDLVASWAKKASVPCYLECGDVNVPIYEKCGYRAVWSERDESEPENPLSLHGMLRDP